MRMIRRAIALAVLTAGLLGALGSETAAAGELCVRLRNVPRPLNAVGLCSPTNL